jgi:hypothetical protein
MKRGLALALLALTLTTAGCGASSSATPPITVGAARTFQIARFQLAGAVAGRPAHLSFAVDQPSGAPLTRYRTGSGPHTGVHVIFVRSDLGAIVHRHPPVGADGTIDDEVTFPSGGRYRMVLDVYPAAGPQRSFQLFRWVDVGGKTTRARRVGTRSAETADGDRFVLQSRPHLRAVQARFLDVEVTDRNGRPARFAPWYGALAHAIFFREGTLDYFHTHVCGPGAPGCTAAVGTSPVAGRSTAPGVLRVGVLLPVPGTWHLFLQTRIDGRVVTAPFRLVVR